MKHYCVGELPSTNCGDAFVLCYEDDRGALWVTNGEYGSQVAFCPYCGTAASAKPTVEPIDPHRYEDVLKRHPKG